MALQGLDMNIQKGELMAIIGNSGSGKSTFLNMVGGLDRPSAGKLTVDGKNLFKLNEAGRVQIPKEILEQMGLEGNKVQLELVDGKVVISTPKK